MSMSAYLFISTVPFLIRFSLINAYNQRHGYNAGNITLDLITSGESEPGGSGIRFQCRDKLLTLE